MNRIAVIVLMILTSAACLAGERAKPGEPPVEHTKGEAMMQSPGQTTYYVDVGSGDDANTGTDQEHAWKSLAKLNAVTFAPGDKILFKAGSVHAGLFKPTGVGTKDAPIIVGVYGEGPRPRIDGEGNVLNAVHLYNVAYFELTKLEITNTGQGRQPKRHGVMVQGENAGTLSGIVLRDLFIHDVNGSVVKKEGGGGAIHFQVGGDEKKTRFDGLLIEGCHLLRCERNGITAGGYWQRDQWHPSLNVVIRKNLLEEIPGDGIVPIACDGALVEHNVMRNCTRLLKVGDAAAGIWPWSCDNTIIQFNEVSDHKAPWDAQGFDSDYNCRNTLIQYNYSHDNEGGFLLICNPGDSKMPHNIGNIGTVVRFNVSVNDGLRPDATKAKGYFSPTFHISGPCKDTTIYNNLIIVPRKPDEKLDRSIVHMDNWGGPWPDNTYFANNIFCVEGTCDWKWGKATKTVFANNLYAGTHEKAPEDATGIRNATPLFQNPYFGKGKPGFEWLKQFALVANSPARRAGIAVDGMPDTDLWGNTIDKKLPNVGPDQGSEKE